MNASSISFAICMASDSALGVRFSRVQDVDVQEVGIVRALMTTSRPSSTSKKRYRKYTEFFRDFGYLLHSASLFLTVPRIDPEMPNGGSGWPAIVGEWPHFLVQDKRRVRGAYSLRACLSTALLAVATNSAQNGPSLIFDHKMQFSRIFGVGVVTIFSLDNSSDDDFH